MGQYTTPRPDKRQFASFKDFYPFYLNEHRNRVCRRLHVVGLFLVLVLLLYIFLSRHWLLILLVPVVGYGFAWTGHFFFEKNKPATFVHPLYSFIGDWVMFKDIMLKKIKF
ncbi:MAG: DUF962 domain-containing protein [Proteobacteria bacterium]|nr:DUF962 domain-containing protein [Pseudomonadota bacterium]